MKPTAGLSAPSRAHPRTSSPEKRAPAVAYDSIPTDITRIAPRRYRYGGQPEEESVELHVEGGSKRTLLSSRWRPLCSRVNYRQTPQMHRGTLSRHQFLHVLRYLQQTVATNQR